MRETCLAEHLLVSVHPVAEPRGEYLGHGQGDAVADDGDHEGLAEDGGEHRGGGGDRGGEAGG